MIGYIVSKYSSWWIIIMAQFYNQLQKSSLHLFLGLPLGLLPSTCPLITFLIKLPWFSITLSFHPSLLLFTRATTASCLNLFLISSLLTQSNLVTPATPLKTFISIACILDLSLSFKTHASQPYTKVGTTTAL